MYLFTIILDWVYHLVVGDIVLINMSNKSLTYWPMERVKKVHSGSDGRVRVATIQTADGIIKSSVVKLTVLQVSDDPSL